MSLAEVTLWGASVGFVAWDPDRECDVFEYSPDFQKTGFQLSPVCMPLSSDIFSFPTLNRDDHCKQISFLMDKAGEWRLSPAYDVTYAYNPRGEFTGLHQMTINRKRENITNEDFLALAKRQGLNMSSAK